MRQVNEEGFVLVVPYEADRRFGEPEAQLALVLHVLHLVYHLGVAHHRQRREVVVIVPRMESPQVVRIGDAEVLSRLMLARAVLLRQESLILFLRRVVGMDVDVLVEYPDLVGKLSALAIVVDVQFVLAQDPPGFPNAHQRGGGDPDHQYAVERL